MLAEHPPDPMVVATPRRKTTLSSARTRPGPGTSDGTDDVADMHLEHVAPIVEDYDEAIAFFVEALDFELVEDRASSTGRGLPKRWVVVRPPGAATGIVLSRAANHEQGRAVGRKFAGRVGLFLQVDDFEAAYARMRARGVEFLEQPRQESYGDVAVFLDLAGNRWDLLGGGPAIPPSHFH